MDGVQISISSWALCSLIADYAAVFHGCLPPVLGLSGKIGLSSTYRNGQVKPQLEYIEPPHCEVLLSYLILIIAKVFIVFVQAPTRRTSQLVVLKLQTTWGILRGQWFENNGAFTRE
ncbi:hypothetical protein PspLS_10912 [Pyricularia sp. CBS 133598]|nr:hypothetical protein PspLS_10912 [Pyricularia sp. CBS 133598]